MNGLLEVVLRDLNEVDEVWINPYAYRLGKIKHFHAMRELVKPYGICLAYVDTNSWPSHPWYFYKEGDTDPAGWLKQARDM